MPMAYWQYDLLAACLCVLMFQGSFPERADPNGLSGFEGGLSPVTTFRTAACIVQELSE